MIKIKVHESDCPVVELETDEKIGGIVWQKDSKGFIIKFGEAVIHRGGDTDNSNTMEVKPKKHFRNIFDIDWFDVDDVYGAKQWKRKVRMNGTDNLVRDSNGNLHTVFIAKKILSPFILKKQLNPSDYTLSEYIWVLAKVKELVHGEIVRTNTNLSNQHPAREIDIFCPYTCKLREYYYDAGAVYLEMRYGIISCDK